MNEEGSGPVFRCILNDAYIVDETLFDNAEGIQKRLLLAPEDARGALKTALSYLYLADGPINLPRDRLKAARGYLEPGEQILIQWLYTRTNGSLRKGYGPQAVVASRKARHRCERCGFPDVRVLNIDHVDGRVEGTALSCLCANCHTIKSRDSDWTG